MLLGTWLYLRSSGVFLKAENRKRHNLICILEGIFQLLLGLWVREDRREEPTGRHNSMQ